jgi:hypothetical protein
MGDAEMAQQDSNPQQPTPRRRSTPDGKRIQALRDQGMSWKTIVHNFGTSIDSVQNARLKYQQEKKL